MPDMKPHVSIIVPARDHFQLSKRCLESLSPSFGERPFEVVFVDNASNDETPREAPALLDSLFPGRSLYIRNENDLHLGPGRNIGARAASGEFILFLNHDSQAGPGLGEALLGAFKSDPKIGAVGAILASPDDGRVKSAAPAFCPDLSLNRYLAHFPGDHPLVCKKRGVQAVHGAAMLMERRLFHHVGGFHKAYKSGFEDFDLCALIRKTGRRLLIAPDAVVFNHGAPLPGAALYEEENERLFRERNTILFVPDLHVFADRDGQMLEFTPWLEAYPALTERQKMKIESMHNPDSPREVAQVLRKEPLFEPGYVLMAGHHRRQGADAELLDVLLLAQHFFPSIERMEAFRREAERQGRIELAQAALKREQTAQRLLDDPDALSSKARFMRDALIKVSENALAQIFDSWLKKHRAGPRPDQGQAHHD